MNLTRSAIAVLLMAAVSAAAAAPPNILLITSEDNGPELGCYGDPYVRTPNLDRLAAEGMRFTRAFVATASCSESRSAILTGLYPHQNGQIGLAPHYRMSGAPPTIPSILKEHGYRTGLVGKLHVLPESAFPFDYRPDVSQCNTFARRDVRQVAKLAEDFFDAGDAPFFLMVNYADAHLPFLRQQHGLPAKPLAAEDVRPLPWIGLDTPGLRQSQADYYNSLMRLDEGVGELLAALERTGKANDTLVIYLGDHGAQFPRGKLACYESSLRIPLLLRWPERIAAGRTCAELVSTIDLLPTILDAIGVAAPVKLPGYSLLPLTSGAKVAWRRYLGAEYHAHVPSLYFPQRTIRDERYKLIVSLLDDRSNPVAAAYCQSEEPQHPSYVTPADVAAGSAAVKDAYLTWVSSPSVELYDLQRDPHELQNCANDPAMAGEQSRLLAALKEWREQTEDPLLSKDKLEELSAEHHAQRGKF